MRLKEEGWQWKVPTTVLWIRKYWEDEEEGLWQVRGHPGHMWLLSPSEWRTQTFPASSSPGDIGSWVKPMLWLWESIYSPVQYSAFPKSHLLTHSVLVTASAQAQSWPPSTHFSPLHAGFGWGDNNRVVFLPNSPELSTDLYVYIWINFVGFIFYVLG